MTYTNDDLAIVRSLEAALEIVNRFQPGSLELADPAVVDRLQRNRVEKMQLLAPAPDCDDEASRLEDIEMLGDGLARHVVVGAQVGQRLAVMRVKCIQQLAPARVGERFEDEIRILHGPRRLYARKHLHVNGMRERGSNAGLHGRRSAG